MFVLFLCSPCAGKFPCGFCGRPVRASDKAVFCEVCLSWVHCKCAGLNARKYRELQLADGGWSCTRCDLNSSQLSDCLSSTPSGHGEPAKTKPATNISIYQANCRSLLPKMDDLRHIISSSGSPSVVALCETWLDSNIMDSEVSLPDFRLFRRDRDRHGGGVALYFHNKIKVGKVSSFSDYEFISAEVHGKAGLVFVGVVYRPPGFDNDVSMLSEVLGKCNFSKYSRVLIVGDFNFDLSTNTCPESANFRSLLDAFGLCQLVNTPTRLNGDRSTTLDLVLSTCPDLVSSIRVSDPLGTSDHCSVLAQLTIEKKRLPPFKRKVWLYQHANLDDMSSALRNSLPPPALLRGGDVDNTWPLFSKAFMDTMERLIPSKHIAFRGSLPGWLSKDVRRCLRRRDLARRRAKRLDSAAAWGIYRKLRNLAVLAIRRSKEAFFQKIASKVRSPRDFWKNYHSLTKSRPSLPEVMTHNGSSSSSSCRKAEMFNNFFVSCFNQPCHPPPPAIPETDDRLQVLVCSPEDVAGVIKRLRPDTSTGPDGISAVMLKSCSGTISEHLSCLFNASLSSGKVPSAWKVSRITPIYKKGDASLVSNYRPISLLSLVSKLLERLIHSALMAHVMANDLLSTCQFGFRPMSSTQEALLSMTHFWHETMEKSGSNIAVFLDLAKAFDTVQHPLALSSLSSAGVCGPMFHWFESYLLGRSQFVVIQGGNSTPASITSGVPQGSILGPILFLLAFNAIFKLSLSGNSRLTGYADDVTYSKAIFSNEDIAEVDMDMQTIKSWLDDQFLRLNAAKVKLMVITRRKSPPTPTLCIDGHKIESVTSFKLLGVTVTNNLSWRLQISNICARAKKLLGFLFRVFRLAGSTCLRKLYNALVLPVLDYSSSIWDPSQKCHTLSLERVQNFAARIISGDWASDSSTLKAKLNLAPLCKRRLFQKLCLCRRILIGSSLIQPEIFQRIDSPRHRHANSTPLHRPYVRTDHHKSAFHVDIVDKWNCTPEEIVSPLRSAMSFKHRLRNHVFH